MKLISLKIKDQKGFSSLHNGFKINFHYENPEKYPYEDLSGFHPFCFAGLNGTGKSNVLEALVNIFYHMECCALKFKPEKFKPNFNPSISTPNAFEIEYFIGLNDGRSYILPNFYKVRITKLENKPPKMLTQRYPFTKDEVWQKESVISLGEKHRATSKSFLPDLVIGYSSGENEILSIPFIKTRLIQYDEYIQALKSGDYYHEPESSLIYMDYELTQAVLLANLLFQNGEVLKPLSQELGLKRIRSFRLNFNLHKQIINEGQRVSITQQLNIERIDKLKKCATSWFEYPINDDCDRLVLDFFVDSETISAVQKEGNFTDAFDFFRALQIMYVLNNRKVDDVIKEQVYQSKGFYTEGKIPISEPSEQVFYFLEYYLEIQKEGEDTPKKMLMKNLSDGEHQFLHTMGICLLLKNHRTLILLDEPETHFNPDWRSRFIKILKNSIELGGGNNMLNDIILTSHSPFIISDCLPDKVIVFEKNEKTKYKVECNYASSLGIKTFGTSINILSNLIYDKRNTIGNHALDKLKIYKQRYDQGEDGQKVIDDLNRTFGDSIEKLMLIKEITEKDNL
ncbi:restriction system-associated AAA family ATPase [Pedobacter sp. CAN_A7]|uniref:restriction system-associated AAA family ATPase n=1 Tax=Pedobacter sp. CAN_A7 TaxID=2787722 RepID=UPI0018CBB403